MWPTAFKPWSKSCADPHLHLDCSLTNKYPHHVSPPATRGRMVRSFAPTLNDQPQYCSTPERPGELNANSVLRQTAPVSILAQGVHGIGASLASLSVSPSDLHSPLEPTKSSNDAQWSSLRSLPSQVEHREQVLSPIPDVSTFSGNVHENYLDCSGKSPQIYRRTLSCNVINVFSPSANHNAESIQTSRRPKNPYGDPRRTDEIINHSPLCDNNIYCGVCKHASFYTFGRKVNNVSLQSESRPKMLFLQNKEVKVKKVMRNGKKYTRNLKDARRDRLSEEMTQTSICGNLKQNSQGRLAFHDDSKSNTLCYCSELQTSQRIISHRTSGRKSRQSCPRPHKRRKYFSLRERLDNVNRDQPKTYVEERNQQQLVLKQISRGRTNKSRGNSTKDSIRVDCSIDDDEKYGSNYNDIFDQLFAKAAEKDTEIGRDGNHNFI